MGETYGRYLSTIAADHILSHTGVRDLRIFEPLEDGGEFVVKTVWDDIPSLVSFAGPEWSRPRIAPAEARMVSSTAVSHHRFGSGLRVRGIASAGRVSVDPASGVAEIDGDLYRLPPLERRLLCELTRRAGGYVEPSELARVVWRGSAAVRPNDVRRAIFRLRKLIGDHDRSEPVIGNRRGYGYRLHVESPPSEAP